MPNRLKVLREDRGLTQDQLAERANMTKGTVSKLERQKLKLKEDQIREFARILKCHPGEILEPIENVPSDLSTEIADGVNDSRNPVSHAGLANGSTGEGMDRVWQHIAWLDQQVVELARALEEMKKELGPRPQEAEGHTMQN